MNTTDIETQIKEISSTVVYTDAVSEETALKMECGTMSSGGMVEELLSLHGHV